MILDLFAGPGGWSEGLHALGFEDVGIEWDRYACETRDAAGFATVKGDIREMDPADFTGTTGLIASPPCQSFSAAGLQRGFDDPRGDLVWQPLRFIDALRPSWVAMEEVKEVMPVWKVYEARLREIGYVTWSGVLNAANYGVPQSRKRAIFIATRHSAAMPEATHAPDPAVAGSSLFVDDRKPWITMADALCAQWGEGPYERMTERGWETTRGLPAWCYERPATTIVRSFCPQVVAAPGYRTAGDGPRQNTLDSVRVTLDQMAVLQGIRRDFPFQGSPTKQLNLCGAILPPPFAKAILAPLVQAEVSCRAA